MLHHPPETFLAVMVLDGVFEQLPAPARRLHRAGRHLGRVVAAAGSTSPSRRSSRPSPPLDLPLKASDYVHRQLWFTPFPTEPVGWMIEQGGDDLFLFSSDYPHPEGGRDPLARFEASLEGVSPGAGTLLLRQLRGDDAHVA